MPWPGGGGAGGGGAGEGGQHLHDASGLLQQAGFVLADPAPAVGPLADKGEVPGSSANQ